MFKTDLGHSILFIIFTGRSTRITVNNRVEIPYCEAILYEVLRLRSPVPTAVPHATTCDTSIGG